MKILVVTPWMPSKERPRSLGLITMLAEDHEVALVTASWGTQDEADLAAIPATTKVSVRMSRSRAVMRAARSLFRPSESLQQAYVRDGDLTAAIERAIATIHPDVIVYNVIRSAILHTPDTSALKVLDMDEFRSGYYRQVAARSTSLSSRLVARVEAPRMARAEVRAMEDFDRVLVSSPVDLDPGITKLRLVRSPHTLPENESSVETVDPMSILFAGRMSYGANVEAIEWFGAEVFPRLLEVSPGLRLDIVGADPAPRVQALQSASVRVHGRVPEMAPHYARAAVSIVPVSMATGVQMKLIESLATGTPTVVTGLCAAQAGVLDGRECLVAGSADAWVASISRLLKDPVEAAAMGERGRRWAQENYGRDAIKRDLAASIVPA